MSGFGGGESTGNGAGFTQSSNAFGGLNNTDLRPRRRRRRPVPMLDTSWVIARRGNQMRKDFTDLTGRLRASVEGIMHSDAANRGELLVKSFNEFDQALDEHLTERYGEEPEQLKKGLNHISAFASALAQMNRTVNAIKTGRPSWLAGNDDGNSPEVVPEAVAEQLETFINTGVLTLRMMVNDSAELPTDEDDLVRAERAGRLAKIDAGEGEEMLVITDLPDDLAQFMRPPVAIMMEAAELGGSLMKSARGIAEVLLEADAIPDEVIEAYPEIFDVGEADGEGPEAGLFKALAARKDPPPFARRSAPSAGDGDPTGGDDTVGDGGEPDDGADEPDDAGDGTPSDPLETMTRLASMIVVIGGSLLQARDGGADTAAPGAVAGPDTPDPNNVGLQRQETIADVPLAKILAGEVAVDPSLADALEELDRLRKRVPTLEGQLTEFDKLKKKFDELQATPAPRPGVARTVAIGKAEDIQVPGMVKIEDTAKELDRLRQVDTEGDSAAALLIKNVHSAGGRPLVELPGR